MDTLGYTLGGGASETSKAAPGSSVYDRATSVVQKGLILPVKYNPDVVDDVYIAVYNLEHNIRKCENAFYVKNELDKYEEIITGNSAGKTEYEELLDLYGTYYNRALVKLELEVSRLNEDDDMQLMEIEFALDRCERDLAMYEAHKQSYDTSCGICPCGNVAESTELQDDGSELPNCDSCFLSRNFGALRKTATMGGLEEDAFCLCGRITQDECELYNGGPMIAMCKDCTSIREDSYMNET